MLWTAGEDMKAGDQAVLRDGAVWRHRVEHGPTWEVTRDVRAGETIGELIAIPAVPATIEPESWRDRPPML